MRAPPVHAAARMVARTRARAVAIAISLGSAAALLPACDAPAAASPGASDRAADAAALRARVHAAVRARVLAGDLARESGWVQTVEVGQLLAYAAATRDGPLYDALRTHALSLVRDDPSDPWSRGMIAWRWRPDTPPDASGTTEALRVAEGLWDGAAAFGRPGDRDAALLALRGYARHAREDQGIWFVANYFNYGTRALATNTYLVDYDPDFVGRVARETGDPTLADLAARSSTLVGRARTPAGLVYDLVQPEIATLLPAELAFFSPNDVVQLSNAATVAGRADEGQPALARGVLDFAVARVEDLHLYYLGRDGSPATTARPGVETWAALVRLAADLDDDAALARLGPRLLDAAAPLAGDRPDLYAASEALPALLVLERAGGQ